MIEIIALVLSIIAIIGLIFGYFYFRSNFNLNADNVARWADGISKRLTAAEGKLRMYE